MTCRVYEVNGSHGWLWPALVMSSRTGKLQVVPHGGVECRVPPQQLTLPCIRAAAACDLFLAVPPVAVSGVLLC